MQRKHLPVCVSLACALSFLALSCDDYDKWTTSPHAMLEMSADTLAWDTLISTVPSTTKVLTVYNHGDRGLRISKVHLGKKALSPFRANVDGQSLFQGEGEDFEVRRKDSIVVRLECTLPETGQSGPVRMEDELLFTLESGVQQRVLLSADAQDAYVIRGLVLQQDSVFHTDKPYVIYDSLRVDSGARLTLLPGTTLMFHDKAGLDVYGTLRAEGELGKPVIFRGDRTDRMFPYLPYDNTPGRWEGIRFRSSSMGNTMTYCDVHSGKYGVVCDSTSLETLQLSMENSIVHNIAGDGLRLTGTSAVFANTQVSNTLGTTVYIYGGAYQFVHCTIAQFYPFEAERGDALFLSNHVDSVYNHLYMAHFINSVITGYGDDVIMGSILEGQDYRCDYLFDHCYLNTPAVEDDERYVGVVWDDKEQPLRHEKNFRLFDTDNFLYDFTPDSLSTIRNMAMPEAAALYPNDRLGRCRTCDSIPDAGCYEFVSQ